MGLKIFLHARRKDEGGSGERTLCHTDSFAREVELPPVSTLPLSQLKIPEGKRDPVPLGCCKSSCLAGDFQLAGRREQNQSGVLGEEWRPVPPGWWLGLCWSQAPLPTFPFLLQHPVASSETAKTPAPWCLAGPLKFLQMPRLEATGMRWLFKQGKWPPHEGLGGHAAGKLHASTCQGLPGGIGL